MGMIRALEEAMHYEESLSHAGGNEPESSGEDVKN